MKQIIKQLCPPIVMNGLRTLKTLYRHNKARNKADGQDLDMYWDNNMAKILETWGEDTVWNEIKMFMANAEGKVLDIACGTGKTMELLSIFPQLDVYGCDISDLLISKAIARGIGQDHLVVCDATATSYPDNYFDYAYSIGSLEHFTKDGIMAFIAECHRITHAISFHMLPVSRSGKDDGWMKTYQSFYNNSVTWWQDNFKTKYSQVYVINSSWNDDISLGKWFVCVK
jgi:ubiquinone/menaquinone biosynthesis C-methylase UbiE